MRARSFLWIAALILLGAHGARAGDAAGDAADARQKALEGDFGAAIAHAQAAVKADGQDVRTARLLQDLLLHEGRAQEAKDLAPSLGSPIAARYLQARLLPAKEAAKALKDAKGDDGAPETLRLDLAEAMLRLGKVPSADSEAKSYVKDHPDDAEGYALVGRIAAHRGKARDARPALERALELLPGYAPAAVLLAEVLHDLKEPAQARSVLATALAQYSSNPELRIGLAEDQVRAGELDAALTTLEALVAERKRYAPGHAHLGHVHRLVDEMKEAEASARTALSIDSGNLLALETLGFVRFKAKDIKGSVEQYRVVLLADPTRIEPYVYIGFCLAIQNELDHAQEMLDKALKLDKEHIDANLKAGVVAYLRGKHRAARKHLTFVLKEDPTRVEAHRYMGYLHLAAGKAKEALKALEIVIQARPDDILSIRMAGRAQFDLGKKEQAQTLLERAVELDEKDHWA